MKFNRITRRGFLRLSEEDAIKYWKESMGCRGDRFIKHKDERFH